MNSELRFPVHCPLCDQEVLTQIPRAAVARALSAGAIIRLRSSCHGVRWDATDGEVEQIRQYLEAARVSDHAEY